MAMESSQLGVWDWNVDTGKVLFAMYRGVAPADLSTPQAGFPQWTEVDASEWTATTHPDDVAAMQPAVEAVFAGPADSFSMVYRRRRSATQVGVGGIAGQGRGQTAVRPRVAHRRHDERRDAPPSRRGRTPPPRTGVLPEHPADDGGGGRLRAESRDQPAADGSDDARAGGAAVLEAPGGGPGGRAPRARHRRGGHRQGGRDRASASPTRQASGYGLDALRCARRGPARRRSAATGCPRRGRDDRRARPRPGAPRRGRPCPGRAGDREPGAECHRSGGRRRRAAPGAREREARRPCRAGSCRRLGPRCGRPVSGPPSSCPMSRPSATARDWASP